MLKIRVRVRFPQKGVKKNTVQFSVLSLPFGKPNNKLFLNMPDTNVVKNVKANCDLVNESIEQVYKLRKNGCQPGNIGISLNNKLKP